MIHKKYAKIIIHTNKNKTGQLKMYLTLHKENLVLKITN